MKASVAGYVRGLQVSAGQQVSDGTILCTLKVTRAYDELRCSSTMYYKCISKILSIFFFYVVEGVMVVVSNRTNVIPNFNCSIEQAE